MKKIFTANDQTKETLLVVAIMTAIVTFSMLFI